MASNEWLVRKLHEQDKKIEALSRGGTGVGHTSIAPGENLTVISDNGEVVLGAGGVDYVDGPTPATPTAPTLKLGFGTIETTWDGSFAEGEDEDGVPLTAPVDFDVVEVHCSTDPEEEEWGEDTMRGQIKTREGGTITVGGFDVDDEVFVCLIALAKTGKRSAPSATASLVIEGLDFSQLFTEIDAANATIKNAGEVLVTEQDTLNDKLSDAFGQIEDAITSANGKNVVHYEDRAPTVDDAGVEGDTWFVGQVGRPNDVIEATNLALNPSMTSIRYQRGSGNMYASAGSAIIVSPDWADSGATALKIEPTGTTPATAAFASEANNVASASDAGKTITVSGNFHLDTPQTGATATNRARRIEIRARVGSTTTSGFALSEEAPNVAGTTRLSVTFTLPSNLHSWFFLLWNGSQYESAFWDSISIQEGTGSTYFDGDTPSGATPNESHYRWTGEPHASTSEKYLPATEGLSSNWNVTEQYRFINGAWENVELSHTVLSSLDLGKLVAGSAAIKEAVVQKLWAEVVVTKMAVAEEFIGENAILTGAVTAPKITASEELWAKIAQFVKIRAEHIEADAIDGMVVTGATIRTSGGSGSWSDAGLFISESDGTSLVRFPTNGEPLSLTASDTNIDRASVGELDVSNGAVRSGGTFSLAAGVTAPASPPELSASWKLNTALPRPPEPSMDWTGFAVWNGLYVRGVNVLGTAGDPFDRIEVYNTDGTLNKKISIDLNPRAGVAVIGDIVYTIGPDHNPNNRGKQWCHGFNLNTGARVSRWEFTRFFASNQKKIAIGTDGTNLLVAGITPSAVLNVMKYNPSTGAQVGSDMATAFDVGYSTDIHGVAESGGKIYVSPREQVREYTVSGSTLTKTAGFAWDNPNRNSGGFTFAGGVPVVVDSGAVYTGSNAQSDYSSELCFTWYNGTYETTPSPVATVNVAARETVFVSLPVRAGLQKRLYYRSAGGTLWARSTVDENVTSSGVPLGVPAVNPPSTNSFPASAPAVLKSGNGGFEVKGDGSGAWGPLTFNADGTMTGVRQTSSGTLTVSAPSGGGTTNTWVTFPEGRFTTAPTVTTSLRSTAPNAASVSTGGATATGFYIYFYRVNDNATGVNWIATEEG